MTIKNVERFKAIVEAVGRELYPDAKPENFFVDFERLEEIYATAYERDPEAFDGVQWVNNEEGMPLWVRPGVEWQTDLDDEDDYDQAEALKHL